MDNTALTAKLWQDLTAKVDSIPGGKRYVEKLKQQHLESEYLGDEVICLHDGQAYQTALEMLAAKVEMMVYMDKVGRLDERRKLKEREFWLSVYEETGLDSDERLTFDPVTGAIRKRGQKEKESSDSYKATLNGFKELIEVALQNPVAAGRMARDLDLPSWLRHMAGTLTSGDLKPNLRQTIEECVADPASARQWRALGAEEGMPQWFTEMASVLGARKKWETA